jgi:hypothetical protein
MHQDDHGTRRPRLEKINLNGWNVGQPSSRRPEDLAKLMMTDVVRNGSSALFSPVIGSFVLISEVALYPRNFSFGYGGIRPNIR